MPLLSSCYCERVDGPLTAHFLEGHVPPFLASVPLHHARFVRAELGEDGVAVDVAPLDVFVTQVGVASAARANVA